MTDASIKLNKSLKSTAILLILFLLSPIIVIVVGIIFFNSNFSTYHFNLYYLLLSTVCSLPIYFLYLKRNSYKNFNDFILFISASLTAVSYVTGGEWLLLAKLPSLEIQLQHPNIFFFTLIKLNIIIICTIAKTIITFHEWVKLSRNEKTTSLKDSLKQAKIYVSDRLKKLKSLPDTTNIDDKKHNEHSYNNEVHKKDRRSK
ncbi:hypothetical protein OGW13_18865 [Citrobacter sp. Ca225]|uniref:hypothetical protein n=1 Tax=Citrobacter sp. Ca225 TaxID=2985002 RepID=UPI002579C406|nr:hypothetical protein [Citrobacter sp. Ca225]MDM3521967.1 hypothetical protein [Citrobacter sp. Ca225]